MLRILGAGPDSELARTLDRFSNQKERLKKELGAFIQWKNLYPVNGSFAGKMPGFGDSDKKFRSGGNFDARLPSISHAHLTHDLSVVYYVDRQTNTLRLYGIYSHDDIGTGRPPDMNRQQQMATRWANFKFDGGQAPTTLQPEKGKSADDPNKIKGKPDYTPRPKTTITTPKPQKVQEPDRTLQFANQIDQLWPQRNLFNKLKNATDRLDRIRVLTSEMAYVEILRNNHALYQNQRTYLEGLELLFRYVQLRDRNS